MGGEEGAGGTEVGEAEDGGGCHGFVFACLGSIVWFEVGGLRHGCRMFARPKCELWVVRHADAQDVHVQSLAPKIPIDTLKKIFLYGFLC